MTRLRTLTWIVLIAVVAGAWACPADAAEAEKDGRASVREFGAVGDGQADDTAAVQRAVGSGEGDVFFPRGVYRLTDTVKVDLNEVGPTALVGTGTARIVMDGPGPAFRFLGTHGGTAAPRTVKPEVWQKQRMPTVDGLEIIGAHQDAVGIEAVKTMQMVISRVNIRNCLHAIHLATRNRNVIISDCHLYENRGVGLYLDDVNLHQINVNGCHISYNDQGGIVSRAGQVRNLHVTGCDLEGNMGGGDPTANILIDCTGGNGGTAEVAITGCTIQHTGGAKGSANVRFIGRDADDRILGHLVISNNVFSDVQVNVDIRDARGVSLVGNTFWMAVQHDLRIENSSNVVVGPNMMDRNPGYHDEKRCDGGVLIRGSEDCTVQGLHINGVRRKRAGLIVEDCVGLNVANCTILDCDNAGILMKNMTGSRVSGCLLRNRDAEEWEAIRVIGGEQNQFSDNFH